MPATPNHPRVVTVGVWRRSKARFAPFDSSTPRSSNLLSSIVAVVGWDVEVELWGLPSCIVRAVFTAQMHLLDSKDPRSVTGAVVVVFDSLHAS